jgi:5'-nucleotidase
MKKIQLALVDMDNTLVNMVGTWIEKYNQRSGENVSLDDITDYDVTKFVKQPDILYELLEEPGFFYDLEPMPEAVEYFNRLVESGLDIVIVTQPPGNCDYAIRDKRDWMREHFPTFRLSDMIFCHRKNLIHGDILFDDKMAHLSEWRHKNPKGIAASLKWKYNKNNFVSHVDFEPETAWRDFYTYIIKNNLKK